MVTLRRILKLSNNYLLKSYVPTRSLCDISSQVDGMPANCVTVTVTAYLVSGSLANCPRDFGDTVDSFAPSETSFIGLLMELEREWIGFRPSVVVVSYEDELASVIACVPFGLCLSCCRCLARRFLNQT